MVGGPVPVCLCLHVVVRSLGKIQERQYWSSSPEADIPGGYSRGILLLVFILTYKLRLGKNKTLGDCPSLVNLS